MVIKDEEMINNKRIFFSYHLSDIAIDKMEFQYGELFEKIQFVSIKYEDISGILNNEGIEFLLKNMPKNAYGVREFDLSVLNGEFDYLLTIQECVNIFIDLKKKQIIKEKEEEVENKREKEEQRLKSIQENKAEVKRVRIKATIQGVVGLVAGIISFSVIGDSNIIINEAFDNISSIILSFTCGTMLGNCFLNILKSNDIKGEKYSE